MVVCAGIEANTQLATDAGLETAKGIKVNDFLQTSDPNIYAIGECLEHHGKTYGLLGPGLEQAAIAVENILLGNTQQYHGTPRSVRAKIKHFPICTLEKNNLNKQVSLKEWLFVDEKNVQFRKLYLDKGYLVKAVGLGEWSEFNLVQQAIESGFKPHWWHYYRFIKTGTLWSSEKQNPCDWPLQSLVCTCSAVTRGQIGNAVESGHLSLESISENTGAMQGCGSCKPIIAQLAGLVDKEEINPPSHHTLLLLALSVLSLFLMAGLFFPSFSVPESTDNPNFLSSLLFDNFWRQVSGYITLTLIILSLGLLVNKRLKTLKFSSYDTWRIVHVAFIALSCISLLFHTNMASGENFNFQVMLIFLITLINGVLLSVLIYFEHGFFDFLVAKLRVFWMKLHIFLFSVFIVFIALHITTVYYF